jgi:hypothetical protein
MLRLDHLAISAARLADGVSLVESLLGVPVAGGGDHAAMGTHNRLIGLGDLYLEVIAVNPAAPHPGRPRWFDLDHFTGPARLTNWVVATETLSDALATGPAGWGEVMDLARGDYRWQMAVPDDGCLPFAGCLPALIHWQGALHPAAALADHGLRLDRLEISHPEAPALRAALSGLHDPRVMVRDGAPGMTATIRTPGGLRTLS